MSWFNEFLGSTLDRYESGADFKQEQVDRIDANTKLALSREAQKVKDKKQQTIMMAVGVVLLFLMLTIFNSKKP